MTEQVFRYNERHDGAGDSGRFLSVAANVSGKRLTYKALKAAKGLGGRMAEANKSRRPADPSRGGPGVVMMERMKHLTRGLISVPQEEQKKMTESKAVGRIRGRPPTK